MNHHSRPEFEGDPQRSERGRRRDAQRSNPDRSSEHDPERGQSIGREPTWQHEADSHPERDPRGGFGGEEHRGGLEREYPDYHSGAWRDDDEFGVARERYGEEWQQPRRFGPAGSWYGQRPRGGSYGEGFQGGGRGHEASRGTGRGMPDYGREDQQLVESGPYAGRGPKGYKRSDERIQDEINERLTADSHIDASELTVSVRLGEVTLEGTVRDRETKRAAEDCVESIGGAQQVHNHLRVERGESFGAAGGGGNGRESYEKAGKNAGKASS